jgi:hypothetical protein
LAPLLLVLVFLIAELVVNVHSLSLERGKKKNRNKKKRKKENITHFFLA